MATTLEPIGPLSRVRDQSTGATLRVIDKEGNELLNGMALYATLALTATSSGKRQALGSTNQVRFTAGGAGSIYVKFTNASAAIAVSSSDTTVDCNASSAVTLNVPSGYAFLEYLRVGGSDVNFNLGLMA